MKINQPPEGEDDAKPNYEDLWRRLAEGDSQLNKELYKEGYLYVKGRLGGSAPLFKVEEVADDAFDVFMFKILEQQFDSSKAPSAFLKGIADNKCHEFWRKEKREQPIFDAMAALNEETPSDEEDNEKEKNLLDCYNKLSIECREVLDRTYYKKESDAEIAKALGYTRGFVKQKRLRCLKSLKKCIEEKQ